MLSVSWGEILAFLSLTVTVVSTIVVSHRLTGKRFDGVTTLVHTEINDMKEKHLKPIEKHLATLNGRVGKNEIKIDEHKEQHARQLSGLEQWAGKLDEDVSEVRETVATLKGQLNQA